MNFIVYCEDKEKYQFELEIEADTVEEAKTRALECYGDEIDCIIAVDNEFSKGSTY